jgi:hypothetical protein
LSLGGREVMEKRGAREREERKYYDEHDWKRNKMTAGFQHEKKHYTQCM